MEDGTQEGQAQQTPVQGRRGLGEKKAAGDQKRHGGDAGQDQPAQGQEQAAAGKHQVRNPAKTGALRRPVHEGVGVARVDGGTGLDPAWVGFVKKIEGGDRGAIEIDQEAVRPEACGRPSSGRLGRPPEGNRGDGCGSGTTAGRGGREPIDAPSPERDRRIAPESGQHLPRGFGTGAAVSHRQSHPQRLGEILGQHRKIGIRVTKTLITFRQWLGFYSQTLCFS